MLLDVVDEGGQVLLNLGPDTEAERAQLEAFAKAVGAGDADLAVGGLRLEVDRLTYENHRGERRVLSLRLATVKRPAP